MHSLVLTPPYVEWQAIAALPGTTLPLGSILFERHAGPVVHPLPRNPSPAVVPHVPRIIAVTPEDGDKTEYHATGLLAQVGISSVLINCPLHPPSPPHAVRMIRERPDPSSQLLAAWFANRLGAHWILPRVLLLAASVCCGCESGRGGGVFGESPRNLRHHAHRWLNCQYRDFRRILLLALVRRPLPRVKHLPEPTGVSLPRLRGQVRGLLGVSLSDYNAWPGWEWVLESAVRQRVIQAGEPASRQVVLGGSLRGGPEGTVS